MRVGIANDHAGVDLKEELERYLTSLGYEVIDYGTDEKESVDYPDYAKRIGESIQKAEIDFGIAICYTGIGMSIACNRMPHVRAAKVDDMEEVRLSRSHNNANVLVLSARKEAAEAKVFAKTFLETPFSEEARHIRRVGKLDELCI